MTPQESPDQETVQVNKKSPAGRIIGLLGLFLLIIIILFALGLLLPRLFGIQEFTVVSGSMEPAIPVGSLVFVSPCEAGELSVGDVVAYQPSGSSRAPVVHRVTGNDKMNRELRTKGDANGYEDILPVAYDQVIGKVVFTIPQIGKLFVSYN